MGPRTLEPVAGYVHSGLRVLIVTFPEELEEDDTSAEELASVPEAFPVKVTVPAVKPAS